MKWFHNLPAAILAGLLAACLFAFYSTRDTAKPGSASSAIPQNLVDTSQLQSVIALAPGAATPDEQAQARDAWRLADHSVDLAFAAALRQAEADAAAPPSGPLRDLSDRIDRLKSRVDDDKKRVDDLTKSGADGLELAQAQLTLDQDELDDAQEDLDRQGGDQRARLQRLLQEHEASDKIADQGLKFGALPATGTLSEQLRTWLALGGYSQRLRDAAAAVELKSQRLLAEHNQLEKQIPPHAEPGASVDRLRQLSAQRKTLTGLDQRVQDMRQLVAVEQRWQALAESRQRAALHLMLRSLAAIFGILLGALLLHTVIVHSFHQKDRRKLHQLRVISRTAFEVAAVLLILLILFGPPTQLSTFIGLVTAGLTVVMKDFIVAFFGWFTLMGKNGISVGDWVEIEGVSGEVIEIGLLRTVLLEMGNWTERGHPTGRRVAFSNSFAMEHHYFNFSTAGQWLWDDLQVTVPATADPYEMAQKIRELVERETQTDAEEAAGEWTRVAGQYAGARDFSSKPAVSLRPSLNSPNSLDVTVRYISRAPQRNAVKSRLYQSIVELMRQESHA